jgi:hypothetical protein
MGMNPQTAGRKTASPAKDAPAAPQGFFHHLLSLFSDSADPERRKRKLLAAVAREYRWTRSRFYHPRTSLVDGHLARFFFEIYRVLAPAQRLLSQKETSGGMRALLIDRSLPEDQRGLRELFTEESLRQRAADMDPGQFVREMQESLKQFFANFDAERIQSIKADFRLLSTLLELIHFDYYFLLRKFDSRMAEGMPGGEPRFESISVRYVLEELESFLEILQGFDPQASWDRILDILKEYRGVEVIARAGFRRLLRSLGEVKRSRVLELIVQLALQNPFYRVRSRPARDRVLDEYLASLKLQVEMVLQKIAQESRRTRIDDLAGRVFGSASVTRLNHYTEKASQMFTGRLPGGYTHAAPLDLLAAFLTGPVKNEYRPFVELLAIHARWNEKDSAQALSESFHRLMEIGEAVTRLDDSLGDGEDLGRKIHALLIRSERSRESRELLRQQLREINQAAWALIARAGQSCITFGRLVRQLIDDRGKSPSEVILNWKEVQSRAPDDLAARMVSLYKQLYYFIQLLQSFNK